MRPAHADLADLPNRAVVAVIVLDRHFGGGDRQTDGPVEVLRGRIDAGSGRGLGKAPGLCQHVSRDLLPALGHGGLHGHAASQGDLEMAEIDAVEAGRVQQGIEQRVHTGDEVEGVLLQLRDRRREVAGIDDQHVLPAQAREQQAIRRQRKDVIQRNRGDQHARLAAEQRSDPGLRLQHVGADVAVTEHGPLGDSGCPAGVLQEGDVLRTDVHGRQRFAPPSAHRGLESDRPPDAPRWDLLAHVADDEVDDGRLRQGQEFAGAGDEHVLDLRARQDLLHHMGEILEHEDRRRA